MIIKNLSYVITTYLIGIGIGYILKAQNTDIYSSIIPIFFGIGIVSYILPMILEIDKKEK